MTTVRLQSPTSLYAAKLKYRQLFEEIENVQDDHLRTNMVHTHQKLGSFLEEAVGTVAWRAVPLSELEGEEEKND